ncbi:MAG: TIGR00270 family protein [Candidatus Brockarchaeota archaeon]|nr:TIGR00270 family protein [Candidatus Brockarchaeota archaeon]
MICEICGGRASRLRRVVVEGSVMSVCPECFNTLTKKIPVEEGFPESVNRPLLKAKKTVAKLPAPKPVEKKAVKTESSFEMELVENYRDLIKNRMRELGWSEEELGARTGLKVSLIRKIEAGRIVPSIPDTRKMEDVLKIKLLKPGSTGKEHIPVKHVAKPLSSITLGDVLREESSSKE